jgi:hypothetical protein
VTALLQDVWPYLLLFYVLESLVRVEAHQRLFVRGGLRPARCLRPGLHLAGLDPFEEVVVAAELPFVPTPDGLLVPVDEAAADAERRGGDELAPLAWDGLGDVAVRGTRVAAGGRTLPAPAGHAGARRLAALIATLRDAGREERMGRVRTGLEASFDLAALRHARQRARVPLLLARLSGAGFALVFFLALPLCLYGAGGRHLSRVAPLVVASLLLWAAGTGFAAAALRTAGLRKGRLVELLLPILLFPPAVAHVARIIGTELHPGFEPLALAAALLPERAFRRLAREAWYREQEALKHSAGSARAAYWSLRLEAWDRLVAASGSEAATVLASPPPEDASAASYCPLCSTQYRSGFARCAECAVELRALGADPRASR